MPAVMFLATLLALPAQKPESKPPADNPKSETRSPKSDFTPDPDWKPLGKSLWFDPKTRRLILRAHVALTEGFLEHLLCREQTKEHESILATGAEPKQIHAGLLLTGAESGHPVRFRPKFEPPAGSPIQIELEWTEDGKTHHA